MKQKKQPKEKINLHLVIIAFIALFISILVGWFFSLKLSFSTESKIADSFNLKQSVAGIDKFVSDLTAIVSGNTSDIEKIKQAAATRKAEAEALKSATDKVTAELKIKAQQQLPVK